MLYKCFGIGIIGKGVSGRDCLREGIGYKKLDMGRDIFCLVEMFCGVERQWCEMLIFQDSELALGGVVCSEETYFARV